MTDEKYKAALSQFLKKKGESVYTVEDPKQPPSFSKEKPAKYVQPPMAFPFDRERWVEGGARGVRRASRPTPSSSTRRCGSRRTR